MTVRLRVPRPSHTESDHFEQEAWKKLGLEFEPLKAAYPEAEVELWCEDEHRLGLKPIIRRVNVPEGETPVAKVNWRYKWLWLYAFVHSKTGETYWWIQHKCEY